MRNWSSWANSRNINASIEIMPPPPPLSLYSAAYVDTVRWKVALSNASENSETRKKGEFLILVFKLSSTKKCHFHDNCACSLHIPDHWLKAFLCLHVPSCVSHFTVEENNKFGKEQIKLMVLSNTAVELVIKNSKITQRGGNSQFGLTFNYWNRIVHWWGFCVHLFMEKPRVSW